MRGGMITGEARFTVDTIADANGKFMLITFDWPEDITATSPGSRKHGRIDLAVLPTLPILDREETILLRNDVGHILHDYQCALCAPAGRWISMRRVCSR
jgi:hypothetical protein